MANDVKAPRRISGGLVVLLLAWLLYLGALAGGAGYLLYLGPVEEPAPESAEQVAERSEQQPPAEQPASAPAEEQQAAADETPPPAENAAPTPAQPQQEAETPTAAEPATPAEAPAPQVATAPAEPPPVAAPPAVDSRPPWQRFARPFDQGERRPRLAVVVAGLGLSTATTEAAIRRLPPEISLSFSPYASGLPEWMALARANGHEVLLDLPMEPSNFPADDPGPQALLTSLDEAQNLERLSKLLERGSGFVGVASMMGGRFTASALHLRPVLSELKTRGLLFLDSRTTDGSLAAPLAAEIGLPVAVNDRALDSAQASSLAIDSNLIYVERQALAEGAAVALGHPYPVTIERLVEWSKELGRRGIVLAPVSAVVGKQEIAPLVSGAGAPPAVAPAPEKADGAEGASQ